MTSMTDGLLVANSSWEVRYCNDQVGQLLGLDHRSLVGLTVDAVLTQLSTRIEEPASFWHDWSQARTHVPERPRMGFAIAEPVRRDLSLQLFPIEGGEAGVGILLYDVTAERDLTRTKDELVSVVSHELRTPLASVVGFAELLLTRDYSEEQRRTYLRVVVDEGQRLTALINDFLDLQRMESQRSQLTLDRQAICPLIEGAVAAAGNDAERPIILECDDDLPCVMVDADRIWQVMTNLFSNARKYSPHGGTINVHVSRVEDSIQVSVADHGLGLPPEALPRLFEKFYRVDNSDRRSIKGTGLGLAIVKQIVNAHGGKICADSPGLGQGTCFRFTLPILESAAASGEVLIVENDPGFARLVEAELAHRGLSAVLVTTAEEALERLHDQRFSVMVLDLFLPGLQGEDLLRSIRPRESGSTSVIVVTVKDLTREERAALLDQGVSHILHKGAGVASATADAVTQVLGGVANVRD
jgi:signal transduction histidine kinase/CheY-like chemotaxis protein